jgi:2-dehydropantoate 2-reductase
MKIAVVGGAGAMGSILGGTLFEAGNDVTLVDVSKPAVDAINTNGLRIENKAGETRTINIPATTDPATVGAVDLVIVFVKCYHTEAAVKSAAPLLGPDTAVLSLQNGWGNAPKIAEIVGAERILAGVTYHSGGVLGPGHVKQPGVGMTFIGELDGKMSERLARIAAAFSSAGLETTQSPSVINEIWKKLALNTCTLPSSALLSFTADQLVQHDGTMELMRAILTEVAAVAHAQDIDLDFDERWEAITSLLARAVGGRSSMLQDVENKRRTEIDVINGAIVAAGKRLGISTPTNDAMVYLVKSLEETF